MRMMGVFEVGSVPALTGNLKFAGPRTKLSVYSDAWFNAKVTLVRGQLTDLSKVSLLECISSEAGGSSKSGEHNHYASIFPHFVLRGDQYFDPNEDSISEVHFVIDDAPTLFYDFDAFGNLVDAKKVIRQVVEARRHDREIQIGEHPQVAYFTGKREIFTSETKIGTVSAYHSPTWSPGGPKGVQIKNTIRIGIRFERGEQFQEAMDRVYLLRNYLGILVGRPQKVSDLQVLLRSVQESTSILGVYWSWSPTRRKGTGRALKPHPGDVLIDAVRHPDQFSKLLAAWLESHTERRDARVRFFGAFEKEQKYGINRLVAVANMFDILPSSAVPEGVDLAPKVEKARKIARRLFRELPEGTERSAFFDALDRLGKASLKRKIQHRTQIVLDAVPSLLPDLVTVVNQAVDCRNYFVHGSRRNLDYGSHPDLRVFFTDTLEFLFAASEMLEAGWNIEEWLSRTSISHPFGAYVKTYDYHRRELLRLLREAKEQKLVTV